MEKTKHVFSGLEKSGWRRREWARFVGEEEGGAKAVPTERTPSAGSKTRRKFSPRFCPARMQVTLQSSISTLNLSEVDGERLFFHKNVEKSA